MADAGEVLLGAFGRELLCAGQTLFLIFLMAGHLVTFTVALNSISGHATCSMVFGVVGLVVSLICSLPRTMKNISWLSILSFISILSGVFVTMISVGITKPGTGAAATTKTDLYHGFSAVSNIVFSYAGHIGYYSFMGELKDAHDFPKALYLLQAAEIGIYLLASLVIYRYAGADVASPALGSAPSIVSKIAYGLALPAILISGVVAGHVASKLIYMRISHGTDRMHKRDFLAIGSWIAVILTLWVLAWIIAEAIPGFNSILTLISALFASWFSYGLPGFCWLHMNAGSYFASGKKILLTLVNASTIGMAFCICGLGVYVAGKDIHSNHSGASFSCANNA
ncbi:transmembrane amino acid transporter protein-domain-containing protein [Aspergillus transmontanensis]|uniref:Transmembrane amino acid transporter protein-domain-containing protein n=1 Tax=Aspergillus transmontanensis TaxID=1034304 RepID=A0A5N6WBR2_9EURO|nr:transmembrane amino acid transporter protein-domain-containing protein [Aspergillus transmontanensis]